VRVKILSEVCGTPAYHTGEIVELEDRIAQAWIKDGLAVLSRDEKPAERAVK
jgi:hypothetical protein